MMGLDLVGPMLVVLALSLMAVSPLHITIARSKEKVSWLARANPDEADEAPHSIGRDKVIEEADAALADDPLIRATGELADIFNHI